MKATRGGMARARVSALATAAVLAACGGSSKVEQTPRAVQVGSFVGVASPATGAITITPTGIDPIPMGLTFRKALSEIPVHQNGTWGDVDEGAVEMRTVQNSWHNYANGCGGTTTSANMFQADVEIRSGYRAHLLRRIYVEITFVDSGFESCLSVPSPSEDGAIGDSMGLFSYPDITSLQGSSTATWTFRLPDTLDFRFEGRVWAELVELSPPTTSSTLAPGTYASTQAMTLSCTDNAGGDGCANTYFSVDYAGTTPYTAPLYPSGSHTLCYWSDDLRGNIEPSNCGSYAVTAPGANATYDGTVHAPRCPGFASSCDTGPTAVLGRGTITNGIEPNRPNTVDGCTDGNVGTYGSTESIDRVMLGTDDGGPLAPGVPVHLTADVVARNTSDVMDVFWASTTSSPTWTWLGTTPVSAAGAQTLSYGFTLPAGACVIRTHLGPALAPGSACGATIYDDQDDLVFLPAATAHGTAGPSVTMDLPGDNNGLSVEGSILLTASASDDREVSTVEFFWGESNVGPWTSVDVDRSPPWARAWDTTLPTFTGNTLYFRAVATDNDNNQTESVVGSSTLREVPAVPVMTAPADGATPSRTSAITVSATASKPHGIASVDFYADGAYIGRVCGQAASCTGHSNCTSGVWGPSYSITWTPGVTWSTTIPHKIYARATDFGTVIAQSPWVSITLTP